MHLHAAHRRTHALLELLALLVRHRVGLADDGDHVDTRAQAAHQLNVHLAQRVARGRDEVEQRVHTVVAEARVALDARLLSENVVVLALEEADDFLEAARVV
jgi:hypothetical protein